MLYNPAHGLAPIEPFRHGIHWVLTIVDLILNSQPFLLAHVRAACARAPGRGPALDRPRVGLTARSTVRRSSPLPNPQVVYLILYALTYICWSLIFHATGLQIPCDCPEGGQPGCTELGETRFADRCGYIYDVYSWHEPASAGVFVVACIILASLAHVVTSFLVTLLKRWQGVSAAALFPSAQKPGCAGLRAELTRGALAIDGGRGEWVDRFSSSPLLAPRSFVAVRAVLFAFQLAILIWIVEDTPEGHMLVYLTNWSNIINAAYLGLALVATIEAQRKRTQRADATEKASIEGITAASPPLDS